MSYLRHLFEYNRSRSQAGFGSKLEQRLQKENITKDDLWDQMEEADPTPNKQYVGWLIKQFQDGIKIEDLISRGADGLKKFELLKKKKILEPEHLDISRFRTLTDLEDALEQYDLPKKELTDRGKYKEVLKTNNVRILEVFDLAAACYYGQGTRWCTAADTKNRFEYYIKQGPIFIVLPQKPTYVGEKYQFWYNKKNFEKYELRDEKDRDFKYRDLKSKFPDIIKFFNDLILEKVPENKLYKFFHFIENPSEELQLDAISKNSYVILYIDNPSEKVKLAAVSQTGYSIKYIKNPSEKVQLIAVSENGFTVKYIKNPSEKVQLAAVKQNGSAIQYIDNPSEKIQLIAVSQNGFVIQHIKNPSEKVKLAAILQDGYAIGYIDNPSEKIQLAAVKQDKDSVKYIKNPTEKVIELSKQ